jgi:DNA-binding MarR family transcriptional regulator
MLRQPLAKQEPATLLLSAIRRRIKQVVIERVRPHGLSPQQFWVLNRVLEFEGSTLGMLAESLHMDQPTASRVVTALARLKLVRMVADPADRRRKRLVLTPRGRSLAQELAGLAAEVRDTAESGLSADERARLRSLLTKVLANVSQLGS